jgi:hypothetical protein
VCGRFNFLQLYDPIYNSCGNHILDKPDSFIENPELHELDAVYTQIYELDAVETVVHTSRKNAVPFRELIAFDEHRALADHKVQALKLRKLKA